MKQEIKTMNEETKKLNENDMEQINGGFAQFSRTLVTKNNDNNNNNDNSISDSADDLLAQIKKNISSGSDGTRIVM